MKIIRWGILAPGSIAKKFVTGLKGADGAVAVAAGSRDLGRAQKFCAEYNIPKAYGSYEELVKDPDVDAVYIASPHPFHKEHALLCLRNNKAVLCEKPFTVNAKDAEEIIKLARERKVFCMEAMWTRFLPHMRQVRKWIDQGAIGEVQRLTADFSFRSGWNPEGRLLNPALAGGGLMDVGIYVTSLAYLTMRDKPSVIKSFAQIGATGVDEQAGIIFGYKNGSMATITCGVRVKGSHAAEIIGTEGTIEIPTCFWNGTTAILKAGNVVSRFEQAHKSNGYEFEADEVAACLREGKTESAIMPLSETLDIMKTLDEIRGQWGLRYPFEK